MKDTEPARPLVTAVIPCLNEARFIQPMLRSIFSNTYPRTHLDVIFVDGMSTDGTRDVLAEAASAHPFIRVLDNPRVITPIALNLGIKAARGEIIVRMDAHAEYPDDYIDRCVRLLQSEPRIGSAGGRSVPVPSGDGPWARAVAFVTAHRFGIGNVAYVVSERPGPVDTVAFGTFRRSVLEEVGFFDERLTRNQDNELHARLQKANYTIAFDPAIVSYYRNRPTLRGLSRQAYVTGMWNIYTLLLHPHTWKLRRFVPMAFVSYLALLAAAGIFRARWFEAACAPLAVYAALVALFSFRSGERAGSRLRVAATFVSYHLAYGAGPMVGVFNVLTGRWRSQLGRPLNCA
ncbi:MAG: glycosyltransferase family 2 protein [Elusimicrobiota bacterium]